MYNCEECGLTFIKWQEKANHVRWHHKKITYSTSGKKKRVASVNKRYGKVITKTVKCHSCDKKIDIKFREKNKKEKYFCSRSCANKRTHSPETIAKISAKIKKYIKEHPGCNVRSNADNKRFSSKIERELIKKLKPLGFKASLRINHKDYKFDVDIYHENLNLWIESDGVYHFKKVHKHHNFSYSVLRDQIEAEYVMLNNIILIRIDNDKFNITEQISIVLKYLDLIKNNNIKRGAVIRYY